MFMIIRQKIVLFLFFVFFHYGAFSDVLPKEGRALHYNTVYFEEEVDRNAGRYELVLSDSTGVITKLSGKLPAFWISDLNWGAAYKWTLTAYSAGQTALYARTHTFSIRRIRYQNYDETRIDVRLNNKEKNAGGLISLDYTRSILTREGKPVWTIPEVDTFSIDKTFIRDLKITRDNTITFLTVLTPYEVDPDGRVLWKAPVPFVFNKDTVVYHHDFKKTNKGTYMVLGDKKIYRKVIGNFDEADLNKDPDVKMIDGVLYKKTVMSILLEFNLKNELIWYWDGNDYVTDEDLNYKRTLWNTPNFATHANAFGVNEEGTKIYVSFRNLSRIVRIDKKSKKVDWSYGESYPSGEATYPVNFKNQHDANVTRHNSIYILNNNGFQTQEGISSVMELRDNLQPGDNPLLWKFDLNFDTLTKGKTVSGGNIVELPNGNLLVTAGALNRVFEVSKEGEIVWDAFLYARGIQSAKWEPFLQYRGNWVKQLNWYHFITQSTPLKKMGKKYVTTVTITNTGNAEDFYDVEVHGENNKLLLKMSSQKVDKNQSFEKEMSFKAKKEDLKRISIVVRSVNSTQSKFINTTALE
jgi:hypothetical protein